jgi:hypothetical protein
MHVLVVAVVQHFTTCTSHLLGLRAASVCGHCGLQTTYCSYTSGVESKSKKLVRNGSMVRRSVRGMSHCNGAVCTNCADHAMVGGMQLAVLGMIHDGHDAEIACCGWCAQHALLTTLRSATMCPVACTSRSTWHIKPQPANMPCADACNSPAPPACINACSPGQA